MANLAKKETIQARYSSKYFEMQSGIVSLNMVINEVSVNCDIIRANEYEGHYLYDLYHGNTSNIDTAILTESNTLRQLVRKLLAVSDHDNFFAQRDKNVMYVLASVYLPLA